MVDDPFAASDMPSGRGGNGLPRWCVGAANVGAKGSRGDAALVYVALRRLLRRNPLVFDELVAGILRSEEVEI
jgi:hypothetical protein